MFAFTICQTAIKGEFANKRITRLDSGLLTKSDYDHAYLWFYQLMSRPSLEAMAAMLKILSARPEAMIIAGAPKPGLDLRRSHVRRWAEPVPANNTLLSVARAWVAIDVDDVTLLWGDGSADRLIMPPPMSGIACCRRSSSGAPA